MLIQFKYYRLISGLYNEPSQIEHIEFSSKLNIFLRLKWKLGQGIKWIDCLLSFIRHYPYRTLLTDAELVKDIFSNPLQLKQWIWVGKENIYDLL